MMMMIPAITTSTFIPIMGLPSLRKSPHQKPKVGDIRTWRWIYPYGFRISLIVDEHGHGGQSMWLSGPRSNGEGYPGDHNIKLANFAGDAT
jgi:hypothetical protein